MALKRFKLGEKWIGENERVYLIGEVGINHNGNMQIVKRLIDSVFACDWDCVKFQKRVPEIAVPDHQKNVMRNTPWGEMTYLDYKKIIELSSEQYDYIQKYCLEKPLDWTCSAWDLPSLFFMCKYDVPFIKIASATLTNCDLLIEACKIGKPIVLSTGMSSEKEISEAVNILEKHGDGKYVLLHTNSSYPADDNELNLRRIQTLKEKYNCLVGYSGHEYDINPTVCAAVLGAHVIERHITVDHNMWGTDQKSSLEIRGMDYLARRIHSVDKYLGSPEIKITDSEKPYRDKLRLKDK